MPGERKTGKVNIRDFIDAQIQGLLEGEALQAKIRDSVEGLVMEVLAEEDVSGGGGGGGAAAPAVIDIGIIRDVVRDELEAAGPVGGGSDGDGSAPNLNKLRKLVAEMVEMAIGDDLDATRNTGGGGLDADAVRSVVREELAEGAGQDADAVRAVVQAEMATMPLGDGGGLGVADVTRIVAETLKAEAQALLLRVRESVGKAITAAQQELLAGDELAARIAELAGNGGGGDGDGGGGGGLAEHEVKDIVAAAFVERLPAGGFDAFLTRPEAEALIAESGGGGGGGEGGGEGGGGLSPKEVKVLVREMLELEYPNREEVKKLIDRAGGGGEGGGGGVDEDAVRAIVGETIAELGLTAGGGGGGEGGGAGLDADAIRGAIQDEVQRAVANAAVSGGGGGEGGGGGGGGMGDITPEQFLNSDAMKEALEDRFRLMQTYIKTDLVPKLVKKALEDNA